MNALSRLSDEVPGPYRSTPGLLRAVRRVQSRHWMLLAVLCGGALYPLWECQVLRSEVSRTSNSPVAGRPASPKDLAALLDHPQAARRRAALKQLGDLGSAAGAALPRAGELLDDADPLVRAHAARAVWAIGGNADAAVPVLVELLDSGRPNLCGLATFLLGEMGPAARDALPALYRRFDASEPVIRLGAAEAALRIDPSTDAALNTLLAALDDQQSEARYFAACAVTSRGSGIQRLRIHYYLALAMLDSDPRVAAAAALTLGRLDRQDAATSETADAARAVSAPELAELTTRLCDRSPVVRRQAAIRAATLGPAAARVVEVIVSRLDDEDLLVRACAAHALWRIETNADAIVPVLVELLGTKSPNASTAACHVLGEAGPEAADALPALYELLESGEPLERLHVAKVITLIEPRDRDAIPVLFDLLHDADSDVRYLAAGALADVPISHRKRAERELAAALHDSNLRVRSAAATALAVLRAAPTSAQARAAIRRTAAADGRGKIRSAVSSTTTRPSQARSTETERGPIAGRVSVQDRHDAAGDETAADANESIDIPALTIAALADEESPRPVTPPPPAPEGRVRAGDNKPPMFDAGTVDPDEGLRPIGALRATARPEGEVESKYNYAARRFAQQPVLFHTWGTTRGYGERYYCWDALALCHGPLYFQDLNAERYGYHYGCCQSVYSGIMFFARCGLLPYSVLAECPCECVYTLGYDRPGNCVPLRWYCLPCPSWRHHCVEDSMDVEEEFAE